MGATPNNMSARPSADLFAPHRARVEIIPLIDVIFFLLATFVLFTLSLDTVRSVPVTLPFGGEGTFDPDLVTLQVTDSGAVYWNREPVEAKEIPARLTLFKQQVGDPRIMLSTDERARLGAAVAVLDQIRHAGITKFSVETRPRPTGK